MTVRLSTGLRTNLAGTTGFAAVFNRGSINIYSGTQPATADSAATGTLLGVVTLNSGILAQETPATGTVTVGGVSGSITALTVGTFDIIPDCDVPYNTSAAQTATDLCEAINRNGIYSATVSGAVVTIRAPAGTGAGHNAYVVAVAGTLTCTYANISGGIAPLNGLTFAAAASGAVSKSGVWGFSGVTSGTAGWFRVIGSAADSSLLSTVLPRLDGSIATSGADLNLSNIAVSTGAPNTIDSFIFTLPAQ